MTGRKPYVTVRALQPLVAGLEARGFDAAALLAAGAIDPTILRDPDGRVPSSAVESVWRFALERSGDGCLGMHVAEAAPMDSFEVHAYAVLSSPTLRHAYRRACRYQRLIHEVNELVFEERSEVGVLSHARPGGKPVPRQVAEFLAVIWVRFGRMLTGEEWAPALVSFPHPEPRETGEHARFFKGPLAFSSARLEVHVPDHILDRVNPRADEALIGVLDRYAEGILARLPATDTLGARVRSTLMQELSGGTPNAEAVARALHMSVRSLHRGLRAEGTNFRELLSQLRHENAVAFLSDENLAIAEVGFLLGFSELSSFYRAFKRWTGKTPAEYRAGLGASSR